jgi:environmental stress-induced protein Ves
MNLQLYQASNYVRTPWKNGTGSTQEIVRDAGEGLDGFAWRLSIADIVESGTFSQFNGYQRIISVLHGGGMQLQVDDRLSPALQAFTPFAFSGDSQVSCQLLAGAIQDFNLIYAPDRYRARLQWLTLTQQQQLFSSSTTLLLFSACDDLELRVSERDCIRLGRYDCLHIESDAQLIELTLQADTAGNCCLIELTPR